MKLTTEELKQIIKEELNTMLNEPTKSEEEQEREKQRVLDLVDDSTIEDLIYQTIPRLQQMLVVIDKEIVKTEAEYHKFHDGDSSWAEDNIQPLYGDHEKVKKAIDLAIDMGFGET
jgi:sulfur carrier protein ThiS